MQDGIPRKGPKMYGRVSLLYSIPSASMLVVALRLRNAVLIITGKVLVPICTNIQQCITLYAMIYACTTPIRQIIYATLPVQTIPYRTLWLHIFLVHTVPFVTTRIQKYK